MAAAAFGRRRFGFRLLAAFGVDARFEVQFFLRRLAVLQIADALLLFDPVKVGFITEGYDGKLFEANKRGDFNRGHEYAAGRTPQLDGSVLPPLSEEQRWELIEYLKTL